MRLCARLSCGNREESLSMEGCCSWLLSSKICIASPRVLHYMWSVGTRSCSLQASMVRVENAKGLQGLFIASRHLKFTLPRGEDREAYGCRGFYREQAFEASRPNRTGCATSVSRESSRTGDSRHLAAHSLMSARHFGCWCVACSQIVTHVPHPRRYSPFSAHAR